MYLSVDIEFCLLSQVQGSRIKNNQKILQKKAMKGINHHLVSFNGLLPL